MSKHKARPQHRSSMRLARGPLTIAIGLAISASVMAQDSTEDKAATLDAVTVTAQKRSENLQKVPISMQVLGTDQLEELQVSDFEDYVKYLPAVSYQTAGPGFAQVYMRGVASGGDGNHSGSLPSVGVYLDEQPITTIQGPLDLHVYDIERVEALSGPQGTLYGASSQAGTLRMITNKPDPSGFAASYGAELNGVSNGGMGYVGEGMLNLPISESSAIRLVGWHKKDAGYIDNVYATRTFPSWDADSNGNGTIDNAALVDDDYNDVETTGARVALRVELDDNWTITPTLMGQRQKAGGNFAMDPNVGDLQIAHFYPEGSDDRWMQAALTIEGKVGNFDLTYAFAHLKRDVDVDSDYSDYAFWYDTLGGYGAYTCSDFDVDSFSCAPGSLVNPSQYIQGVDGYKKTSHELRLSSPQDETLRFALGAFVQTQDHDIEQRYKIDGIDPVQSVSGWPDTMWLTKQVREDKDTAVFGELSYDITDALTANAGMRWFQVDNSLQGYFGFADWGWVSSYGEAACPEGAETFNGAPCSFFNKRVEETGNIGRLNLTYDISDDLMIYGTWSEGYRPGGVNRRGTLPPYLSDYLTNYEFGWKSSWLDNALVWNGSVFRQEWEDFQFAILGANGLTEIKNANQAQIDGFETDLNWAATYNLRLSAGIALYDAELTANYCGFTDDNGVPVTECDDPEAPDGSRLPVTPKFKGNLTARYTFDVGSNEAFVQGALVHVGERLSDLRIAEQQILGDLPSYTTLDISAGFRKDDWMIDVYVANVTDERAELNHFTQCAESVCGAAGVVPQYPNGQVYTLTNQPRSFGIRFSQSF